MGVHFFGGRSAVADFDNDGLVDIGLVTSKLDLLSASNIDFRLLVYRGIALGSFEVDPSSVVPLPSFDALEVPSNLIAEDLDGNGTMEIIIEPSLLEPFVSPPSTPGTFIIAFQDQSGTFSPRGLVDSGQTNQASALIVDLDGSGTRDLVFAEASALSLLRQQSPGFLYDTQVEFLATVDSTTGFGSPNGGDFDTVLVDINGDGLLDVAAADFTGFGAGFVPQNSVGTFDSTPTVVADTSQLSDANALVVADFDSNGYQDFAIGHAPFPLNEGASGTVEIFSQTSSGFSSNSVETIQPIVFGPAIEEMLAADWNGDGRPDLTIFSRDTVGSDGKGYIYIRGATAFPQAANQELSYQSSAIQINSLAAADMDNDGDLDLVVAANAGSSLDAEIFLNVDGTLGISGSSSSSPNIRVSGFSNCAVAIADMNEDGLLDLVGIEPDVGISSERVVIQQQGPIGTFISRTLPVDGFTNSNGRTEVLDWDQDGDLDIIVTGDGLRYLIREPDGSFGVRVQEYAGFNLSPIPPGVQGPRFAVGDVDQDGSPDVVWRHEGSGTPSGLTITYGGR